jgi:hypothetical protein
MKQGAIRKKFNEAVKELSATPEGKNTDRILGALQSSVKALRAEEFDATLEVRHADAGLAECFAEEEREYVTVNGTMTAQGERLDFVLTEGTYEGDDMTLKVDWNGGNVLEITSSWDSDEEKWTDAIGDNEYEDDGGWDDEEPAEAEQEEEAEPVTLEDKITGMLVDVLAKAARAQRHAVPAADELDKTFRVPAQIKLAAPKGKP